MKTKQFDSSVIIFDIKKDPHGWIQWKGTEVCMDVHCQCGFNGHIDDDFVYYLQCPVCKTVYEVNGHIQLIPIKPTEAEAKELGGRLKTLEIEED